MKLCGILKKQNSGIIKKIMKWMEDIEALPDNKDEVYYLIDMAITYNKTKKAYAK